MSNPATQPEAARPAAPELRIIPTQRQYKFTLPKTKFELIREILKRWWYGMPEWPNPNHDYTPDLKARNLRLVDEEKWVDSPIVENGLEKVKAVLGFPGVFVNSKVR